MCAPEPQWLWPVSIMLTRRRSTGKIGRLLSGRLGVRITPSRPITEGQPARRRQPLLRAWHWKRCGDRVSGLPPFATLGHWLIAGLPSRAKGVRFSQVAPRSLRLPARMPALSKRGSGGSTRRLYQLMRHLRRGLGPLKPDSRVRHPGPLPITLCRRRGPAPHKGGGWGRHPAERPC